ncbi:MAG: hypothetical protein IT581_18330 [Verrucomicrobiales bacterium]|nr:hypothetical protein [Verrucomicrobiales bacterium]
MKPAFRALVSTALALAFEASFPASTRADTRLAGAGQFGQLIGSVFEDRNGDGEPSAGENGLGGAVIEVRHSKTGALISQTTTSPAGIFLFLDLRVGDYNVIQRPVAGFFSTRPNQETTVAFGGAATVRFPNRAGGTITGRVFVDANRNGIEDEGETGLAGVAITLHSPSGSRSQITSSADGSFILAGAEPGDLRLEVTAPAGYEGTTASSLTLSLPSGGTLEAKFGLRGLLATHPAITSEPTDLDLLEGASGSLTASVEGAEPLAFIWTKDGAVIPEAKASILNFVSAQLNDAGTYRLMVSNAHGTIQSRDVRVRVTSSDPYVAWRLNQDLPETQQAPADDPDQDGLPNLMEFALGTDPISTRPSPRPRPIRTTRGALATLGFEFTRVRAADKLFFFLQGTTNFIDWVNFGSSVEVIESDDKSDTVRVTDLNAIGSRASRFLRLSLSSTPPTATPATLRGLPRLKLTDPRRFTLEGQSGRTYEVEWSADLKTWTSLRLVIGETEPVTLVDDSGSNTSARFYRAFAR